MDEKKEKVYISGQISNLPEEVYTAAFNHAEAHLRELGFEPVNPLKIDHTGNVNWEDYMITDIEHLFACQKVYMLKNWKASTGARIEHNIAIECGKHILYQQ